ncbi:glycosyltransferase family 39 protein [Limnoglobus roseus]|uniref:Putative glycosyltransferase n=1 Tax=Limnoglobus roseus TaxID=2598579 RepID=A0A5C1AL97_9BACT|nr:glycosyltransferase family 39 protein [Limnoglobus roseus]QEL20179.1 putative glycosyltransferase [Limnoglobus roseus]
MIANLRPTSRLADWITGTGRVPGEAARLRLLLAAWLVVRTVVWTLAVVASHHNAPLDLVEWLSWGGSWQWGYPKHPPLPAWLADAASRLSPGDVWGVYLFSYAVSSGILLAAYRLGREYLSPRRALVATLALDGLNYLTNDPAEFSNNVMLGLGWAWLIVCFHRAIGTGQLRWWLAVGVVAGLTLLCKYTIGVLLLAVLAFALYDRASRKVWRTPGPYLAALVAGLIVLPHALWLVQHDFITLRYAEERAGSGAGLLKRLVRPFEFLGNQALILLPVAFVLWPLMRFRTAPDDAPEAKPLATTFLHFAVLGPPLILLTVSAAIGFQLREIWGSPLWTFVGVWALANFPVVQVIETLQRSLRRWVVVAVGLCLFATAKQVANPYLFHVGGRTAFPGKELTREVNARWAAQYGGLPPIVGGEGWRAGVVCCYSPHRPLLYSSGKMGYLVMEPEHCRWTGDADLNARGGVILWDATQLGDDMSDFLRPRFPRVASQPAIELPYVTGAVVKPTRVGVAFVPPAK